MNRLRIRVGERVKEQVISLPHDWDMPVLEDVVLRGLRTYFQTIGVRLEYLGEYAWDVFIEDRKIGHVKAWKEDKPTVAREGPTLWEWFLLIAAMFLALC